MTSHRCSTGYFIAAIALQRDFHGIVKLALAIRFGLDGQGHLVTPLSKGERAAGLGQRCADNLIIHTGSGCSGEVVLDGQRLTGITEALKLVKQISISGFSDTV